MIYPIKSLLITVFFWILIFLLFNKISPVKNSDDFLVSLEIESEATFEEKSYEEFGLDSKKAIKKEIKPKLSHLRDNQDSSKNDVKAIYNPLPIIPNYLRKESFNSSAIARFYINKDGEVVKVDLIKPCANPKLNHLLLKSLKKWRFTPYNQDLVKDIKVNFEVK